MKKIISIILNLFIITSLFPGIVSSQKVEAKNENIPSKEHAFSLDVNSLNYESENIITDQFSGISSKWDKAFSDVNIYLKTESGSWTKIEDESGKDDSSYIFGEVFNTNVTNSFQYRLEFSANDLGKKFNINFTTFDTSKVQGSAKIYASSDNSGVGPKIISRSEWGANEKYMTWKPEYDQVKAFVIHHTASDTNIHNIDQATVVRNIYYGHAVSNSWGDIGYNYIIDVNGNIYEGRYGGGEVVAGHTLGYNYGTIGISLIGNFETQTIVQAQYDALSSLIAYKSFQYGLDPEGNTTIKSKNAPVVSGHKDLNATACPGANLYGRLLDVRIKAEEKLEDYPAKKYSGQFISAENGKSIYGGDATSVSFTMKNTGNSPWYPKGNNNFTISTNGQLSASLNNFGRSVEPGEIGTFTMSVIAPNNNGSVSQNFVAKVGSNQIANFSINLNITTPQYRAKIINKSATLNLAPGKQGTLSVDVKNVGLAAWNGNTGIKLYTKDGSNSVLYSNGDWESRNSPGGLDNANINSGSSGKLSFLITAPNNAGQYNQAFVLKSSNVDLQGGSDLEVEWNITVAGASTQMISTTTKEYSKNIADYNYSILNQSSYPTLKPGETKNISLEAKNTGKSTWYKDVFRLATYRTSDRDSVFANSSWKAKNRIEMQQDSVAPGATAIFNFSITAPQNTSGKYQEYFCFVVEGVSWMPDIGLYWMITVSATGNTATTAQNYDGQLTEKSSDLNINAGDQANFSIKVKNTGTATWTKNLVHLGVVGDKDSSISDSTWASANRLVMSESEVAPGGVANFNFTTNSKKSVGNYSEKFKMVAEGITWFGSEINVTMNIKNSSYTNANNNAPTSQEDFTYVSQSSFTTMNPGETKSIWLEVKNTGTTTWTKNGNNPVRLATANPKDRTSQFINSNRVNMDSDNIAPGQNVRFTFNITAPSNYSGTYKEYFTLVHDGVSWFKDIGIYWQITVGTSSANTGTTNSGTLVNSDNKVRVSANGPFIVVDGSESKIAEGGSGQSIEAFYKNGKYYMNFNGSQKEVNGWVRIVPWATQTILTLDSYEDHPAWNTSINDNKFKGAIEIRYSTKNKKLWVINDLNIEDYLKGVSEPLEAGPYEYIKSAIIIERSYIYYHLQRGGRWPDDFITLKNSRKGNGDDQIYQGYSFTARSTNIPKAVNDTLGQVVTYNGNPVLTPYYTQSDGRTRSISEVWRSKQSDYPWLVSVPDPWCAGKQMLGHGVGLSGTGARGMANDGKKYDEILKYFYTGTGLGKIDTNRNVRVGIYYIEQ